MSTRLAARGKRADDDSPTTLVLIHENDGSWTVHGASAPGVRLSQADMVALASAIMDGAR